MDSNSTTLGDASASAETSDTNSIGTMDPVAMMLLERAALQADWRMQDRNDDWI